MNKELELREIKTILRYIVENKTDKDHYTIRGLETIKKALDHIENSIPKQLIENKLEDLQKEYKEALEKNSTKAFILKCQIEGFKDFEKELLHNK